MDDCCGSKQQELQNLSAKQKQILWITLAINLTMFFVEGIYGVLARSTALMADSLDMLGDAVVYGASLYAVGRSARWNASISLLKGLMMATLGIVVIFQAIYRFLAPSLPVAETMGMIGVLALTANVVCAVLLLRHRNDDLNMRSTWLCSRNDVIANIGVLVAAGLVSITQTKYPDLAVGIAIAGLALTSSFRIIRESLQAIKG